MNRNSKKKSLTDETFWLDTWKNAKSTVKFYPYKPSFIHFHLIFKKYLPKETCSFLEVGCFPGHYLWYFNKYFGYKVTGIEFLKDKVDTITSACAREGIAAEVISGDFFINCPTEKFDVVGSFGFIEHFEDTALVIQKHIEAVKHGGYIVITAPNHVSPIYKKLLRLSGEDVYNAHNLMSYEDLIGSVNLRDDVKIVASGYCGHFGLGYTGAFSTMWHFPWIVRITARLTVFALEVVSKIIPDNKFLSQAMYMVIRKNVSV